MSCAQTKADTRERLEPRLPARSNRFHARPGGGTEGAGTALSKLREVNFQQNNQDWWGLLAAVSRESGFSLTRIEERCER